MSIEAEPIVDCLSEAHQFEDGHRRYTWGLIGKSPVVVAVTGTGKVNAALTTQAVIQHFQVTDCLLVGVAGSLTNDGLETVIIASDVCYHDFGTWTTDGIVGSAVTIEFPPAGNARRLRTFPSEPAWVEALRKSVASADSSACIRVGRLATGDQFIASDARREQIYGQTGAVGVDMESAAVSQVALANDIPFAALRTVSDGAADRGIESFTKFAEVAARRAAKAVRNAVLRQHGVPLKLSLVRRGLPKIEPRRVALDIPLPPDARRVVKNTVGEPVESLALTSAEIRRIVNQE